MGTDTPRAEVIIDANVAIFDGEFQISVTHFGEQLTTECISWDGTANQMELALEKLDNVDSVRVDRIASFLWVISSNSLPKPTLTLSTKSSR